MDAVIAQGVEAGGHVKGTTSLTVLLPAVADAVGPLPVIGSGGIADGRGLVAALSLGAQAVSIGTRFLASAEANASTAYKERVISAKAEDAIHLTHFDVGWSNAPHRVLRNASVAHWKSAGRPASGQRPGEGTVLGTMQSGGTTIEIPAYSAYLPEPGVTADVEQMALYAGQSCSLIDAVQPAAEIVAGIVREASAAMERLTAWREP